MWNAIYNNPIFTVFDEWMSEPEWYNLECKRILDMIQDRYKVVLDTCIANPWKLVDTNTLEIYE